MLPIAGILLFAQDVDTAGNSAHDIHLIAISVMIIAAGVVLVLLGALAGAIYAMKLVSKVENSIDELKAKANPIIAKGNDLAADLVPKIKKITANVEQISETARVKVDEVGETVTHINQTVQDFNGRTRAQVTRVDGIVSEALSTTSQVSRSVQEGIKAPVRQISGIVTGIKVGLETFLDRSRFRRPPTRPGPYDL